MGAEQSAVVHNRPRSFTTVSAKEKLAPRKSCPEYMTQFDLKQLMKERDSNKNSLSVRNLNERRNTLDVLHQQFYPSPASSNRSMSTEGSDISTDSGTADHHLSNDDLRDGLHLQLDEDEEQVVPSVNILPPTPTVPTNRLPPRQKKPTGKRFFSRMKNKNVEERTRSRSLGANNVYNSDKPGPLFGSSLLNREWELVTVTEMYRRLSLDDSELEIPLPEGSTTSQIMDELMIRQVIDILPPRAVGYPWVNIYSSEKHGFSLATLYRKMIEFDEDLSPVLLIIRDTEEHVFGAIVSGAIRPSEHFTGTGDSSQVWRFTGIAPHTRELRQYSWTGDNQFFVNASKEYLAIGAGSGHYGLWLDADLNHGRTQRCDTFDNEPLTGDKEDFIIQYVEAYGFRI